MEDPPASGTLATPPSRQPLAATWQCGPRRLALRKRFNAEELDAARILQKYDSDGSGTLDTAELKAMMQDFSEGELISRADVEYILNVGDMDRDGVIARSEVLHALKAWYALRNLPKAVDMALQERGLAGGPLPSAEKLRELLEEVNESQPVALEEAMQVRALALALGASEDAASAEQLRGAVAGWYLEIEREESSTIQLGRKSVEGSVRRLAEVARGEFELSPKTVIAGGVLLAVVGILLPVLEILVAQSLDPEKEYQCEHPHMSGTLRTTGCLTLALSTAVVIACVGWIQDVRLVKLSFGGMALVLLVVLLTMEAYGFMDVGATTSARCGAMLWSTCYFVYCIFPLLTVVILIFVLPCLFLKEYLHHRSLDRHLTATARRGRGQRFAASGDVPDVAVEKLPEAEHWQCGSQRLMLRKKFNSQEIDATKIIRKYDKDGSGVLEAEELQELLHDYNGRKPISPEDLEYVMTVSDLDRDDTISKDEVLYGLRVWYAFRNMPKAVGLAFQKHQVHDGPLPEVETLQKLLTTLNESQPVTEEEAGYVRRVCLALGSAEEHVTAEQLRRAVATWYLHIKRPATSKVELVRKSFRDVREKLANVEEHAKQAYHGEVDYHSMSAIVLVAVGVFVALVHPLLELLVATGYPSPDTCEYPELSSKLWWTGVMTLTVTIGTMGCALIFATEKFTSPVKRVAGGILAVLVTALVVMEVFGLLYCVSSTAARCGLVLWTFCHFTYVVLPLLTAVFLCCGMPTFFFIEYFDNTTVDGGLEGLEAHAQA